MARVYSSIKEIIGSTSLVELTHFKAQLGLKAKILAKFEYLNPADSVKDRGAKAKRVLHKGSNPSAKNRHWLSGGGSALGRRSAGPKG